MAKPFFHRFSVVLLVLNRIRYVIGMLSACYLVAYCISGKVFGQFLLKLAGIPQICDIRDSWQAYQIVDMEAFGIHECPAFPANMMHWPHWEDRAIAAVRGFFAFWRERRRVLVYCQQGANRSAAMVCLVMAAASGCSAREVDGAARPARTPPATARPPCRATSRLTPHVPRSIPDASIHLDI